MAGRVVTPPASVVALSIRKPDDPVTAAALTQVEQAIQRLQTGRVRDVLRADLVVGTNKIRHGLGRSVTGFTLVPTVANASFASALNVANPSPELEVWIDVVGIAQPGARIEVW